MEEIEVDISTMNGKAIIEGKTSVPFKTFVRLILQRKVDVLFKRNSDDPVIVSSDLLTALASAPQDKQEDRTKLVIVTFGVGIVAGVFVSAAILLGLLLFGIHPEIKDFGIVLGVIAGVVVLGFLLQKNQKKSQFAEKLYEAMEKTTDMMSK